MKIFISSVMSGYQDRRSAVEAAIRSLGHEVVRAEDFGASTDSPRVACLSGVRASDLVVVVLGERYGHVQESGISATHEEFRDARETKEVLAFVENVPVREARQEKFLDEVREWCGGVFTETFNTLSELQAAVTRVLHNKAVEQARGELNPSAMVERSFALLPESERAWSGVSASLSLAMAAGPSQPILRPLEIESDGLADRIFKLALHGGHSIFDRRDGTDTNVVDDALMLRQSTTFLSLYPDGSMVAGLPPDTGEMQSALIEESVCAGLARLLGLFDDVLDDIDPTQRIRSVCPTAAVLGSRSPGWRTQREERESPHTVRMSGIFRESKPVQLDPSVRPRSVLRTQAIALAEDMTVLLRRQYR